MAGNSFGTLFRITTFGESHGSHIGVTIDGCPAGLAIDLEFVQSEMQRRKPGQSRITTQRKENDEVEIVSGLFEGVTTGVPLTMLIKNQDQRSKDYDHLARAYRPSHADYTYQEKYGHRDFRGGGRASARETAARVAAGAVAKLLLGQLGVQIHAYVCAVGGLGLPENYWLSDPNIIDQNIVRCPDAAMAKQMEELIDTVRKEGDTIGGVIACETWGCPAGWGEPVFDKLHADLGKAMLSINAVKGFEIGAGFHSSTMRGSEHNDRFDQQDGKIITLSNHSGGIQGGISNGQHIYFRTAFKPVATLMMSQSSVDEDGEKIELPGKGRHDPCVVPRAVPIVEAMAALVLADHYLRNQTSNLRLL